VWVVSNGLRELIETWDVFRDRLYYASVFTEYWQLSQKTPKLSPEPFMRDGSQRLYVQQDANWNVTGIVGNSGGWMVLERYVYDPYGKATVRDPVTWAVRNPGLGTYGTSNYGWVYLHQGGRYTRFDDLSGLYHFRMRDYSPTLGRWMVEDPIRYRSRDSDLYGYLRDSAVNRVDPLGLKVCDWWCPFTGSIGYLYIDCSCKDKLKIWIIDEYAAPASEGSCGKWLKVDGFVLNGVTYKVDGSTCHKFTCTQETARLDCCVNLLARCIGKTCPYPVQPGIFGGQPKEPPPGAPAPVVSGEV
jgi:RHS repeat-associated protein